MQALDGSILGNLWSTNRSGVRPIATFVDSVGRNPPVRLVEVYTEAIGTSRNTIVAEQHAPISRCWAPAPAATHVL